MGKKKAAAKGDDAKGQRVDSSALASTSQLPDHLEVQRTRVICGPDINSYTTSTIAASQYMSMGVDSAFSLQKFRAGFSIEVNRYEGNEMEFEMKGVSCAVANSLRRIMTAEAPTMAIEHVFVVNNTSIIQDEVLAHRLGLVPLLVDPQLFVYKREDDAVSERNTIVLKLKVKCRNLEEGGVENENVYSDMLEWLPGGSDLEETGTQFVGSQLDVLQAVPVHKGILLAKLRPGQEIDLECHCVKGVGEEHAKWSPVATTWYRLMPEVVFLKPPTGRIAERLAEELKGLVTCTGSGHGATATLNDARSHEELLEKVRTMSGGEEFASYIQLRKIKDHFIFTIETTGAWKPHLLFNFAVKLMMSKCDKVLEGLQAYPERSF